MRTIYMKRSVLIILVSTSSLISIVYMIDYYLFQDPLSDIRHSSQSSLNSDSSQRKVVLSSKASDLNAIRKCSVTLVLILCEDSENDGKEESAFLPPRNGSSDRVERRRKSPKRRRKNFEVPIAKDFVRQINQTLVLLKSVALQTHFGNEVPPEMRNCVKVAILGEKKEHFDKVKESIENEWSTEFQERIQLEYIPVKYPKGAEWMRKMFRPCATLRLFVPEILGSNYGEGGLVVYVDTDFIFLRSVQSLVVNYFGDNKHSGNRKKVVAGMAPCLFHYGDASNNIPYFGFSGLNAGLMLMNLSRMNEILWTSKIRMVTSMFQHSITLADQDILNIYFHFFPEELQLLSCDWNFRPFQCREGSYCEDSNLSGGISALHGNALSFTTAGPEPLFHAVFQVFHEDLRLGTNFTLESFVEALDTKLLEVEETLGSHSNDNEKVSQCIEYGGFRTLVLNRLETMLRSLELAPSPEDDNKGDKDVDFEIMTELALNHES